MYQCNWQRQNVIYVKKLLYNFFMFSITMCDNTGQDSVTFR